MRAVPLPPHAHREGWMASIPDTDMSTLSGAPQEPTVNDATGSTAASSKRKLPAVSAEATFAVPLATAHVSTPKSEASTAALHSGGVSY
jgi:hypothetical protein